MATTVAIKAQRIDRDARPRSRTSSSRLDLRQGTTSEAAAIAAAAAAAAAALSPPPAAKEPRDRSSQSVNLAGAKGSPFIVSGELFLRSTRELLFSGDLAEPQTDTDRSNTRTPAPALAVSSTTDTHPSAGLLAELAGDLRDLLLCHPDLEANDEAVDPDDAGVAVEGDRCGLRSLVSGARRERRSVRRERIERMKTSKTIAGCMAEARLSAVQKAAEEFRRGCAESRNRLETRLGSLIVRFAAAVGAEADEADAQTAAEREHCRRETERLDLAARLASLAATAEHRTRGNVMLRRLPPNHPQHARCLRAATENVKPGFFSGDSPHGAVHVLDIYKIENRVLLERFQRAAEVTEPSKVKGLFCHVPDGSVEHVVLYGMGAAGEAVGGGTLDGAAADAHPFEWDVDPIDPIWACRNSGRNERATKGRRESKNGASKRAASADSARAGEPLVFPRAFSRHSTLEEEREYANGGARSIGAQDAAGSMSLSGRPPPREGPSGGRDPSDEGGKASGLRFLALCRVMIGSMYVSPSPSSTFTEGDAGAGSASSRASQPRRTASSWRTVLTAQLPRPPSGQAEYDAVFFPRDEEYLLLKEAFVLPEFLVVQRFVASPYSPPSSGSFARSTSRSPSSSGIGAGTRTAAPGAGEVVKDGGGNAGVSGTPTPPTVQNAAAVAAAIEAAMNCNQANIIAMQKGTPPPPPAIGPPSRSSHGGGAGASSTPDESDAHAVADDAGGGRGRGGGRASRHSTVRAVEQLFEHYRQEVDRLKEMEKGGVAKSAMSTKIPRQPP